MKNEMNLLATRESLTNISNDVSGNPRQVVHFTNIGGTYDSALKFARMAMRGVRKYNCQSYGGGIAFLSANELDDLKRINLAMLMSAVSELLPECDKVLSGKVLQGAWAVTVTDKSNCFDNSPVTIYFDFTTRIPQSSIKTALKLKGLVSFDS